MALKFEGRVWITDVLTLSNTITFRLLRLSGVPLSEEDDPESSDREADKIDDDVKSTDGNDDYLSLEDVETLLGFKE